MSALFDLLKEFDIAKIMPAMDTFVGQLAGWMRFFLLIGPLLLVGMGAWYYFAPPNEANYALGFRSKHSMGSVEAWKFAQNLAGRYFMLAGGACGVIMLIISLFFGLMGPLGMAIIGMLCAILEVVGVVLLHRMLDKLVSKRFDQYGNPRK